ncbi:MAG: hypothetical protein ACXACA_05385 [Candidatus Ranarchaeia archaeon]|jgi:hypothetical protein
MKTYVTITFNSEGAEPLKIVEVMRELGFDASFGQHDFVYNWKEPVPIESVMNFLNKVHSRLKGLNFQYTITTIH